MKSGLHLIHKMSHTNFTHFRLSQICGVKQKLPAPRKYCRNLPKKSSGLGEGGGLLVGGGRSWPQLLSLTAFVYSSQLFDLTSVWAFYALYKNLSAPSK